MVRLTENAGVIYEVNLEADAEISGPFDTWLRDHIADMLQFPGFLAAEILATQPRQPASCVGPSSTGCATRLPSTITCASTRRRCARRASSVSAAGTWRSGAVLAHREDFISGAVSTENCLNCGEVLTGQHCSHCGNTRRSG